jgi:hypothetical protein
MTKAVDDPRTRNEQVIALGDKLWEGPSCGIVWIVIYKRLTTSDLPVAGFVTILLPPFPNPRPRTY